MHIPQLGRQMVIKEQEGQEKNNLKALKLHLHEYRLQHCWIRLHDLKVLKIQWLK